MMHEDEIDIPDKVVRDLIGSQFPDWANQPVQRIESSGTVNAIFRIGEELSARFPLRAADPEETLQGFEDEARASAEFNRLGLVAAPVPVAIGRPGSGYPLPWSVQTWLPGTVASDTNSGERAEFARDLAILISGLRNVDTGGRRFEGSGRGGELRDHDEWVGTWIGQSTSVFEASRLAELWNYFRELPRTSSDVMTHGDLTPHNVLVDEGRLVGVLDCGGFGPADPSLDVIVAWHLLDDDPRAVFRDELQCDELEWERSKAWAFEQALGAFCYYADSNLGMYNMGLRTLRRIIADSASQVHF